MCHNCDGEYKSLGKHWSFDTIECDPPQLSDRQHQIITGMLMGDSYVGRNRSDTPFYEVKMTNKTFIQWLANELKEVVSSYGLREKSSVKKERDGEFAPNSDRLDIYYIRTFTLPELEQYRAWYSTGKKLYSNDLELTPLILKMWFVSDGTINHRDNGRDSIHLCKHKFDSYTEDLLRDLFNERGWDFWRDDNILCFDVETSYEMWDYMGEMPPGMKYKSKNSDSVKPYIYDHVSIDTQSPYDIPSNQHRMAVG